MLPSLEFGSDLFEAGDLNSVSKECNSDNIRMMNESIDPFRDTTPAAQNSSHLTKPASIQESKSFWKKSIGARQSWTDLGTQFHQHAHKRPHIRCTKRAASIDSIQQEEYPTSTGVHLFCRPPSIPVWPHLRQTRHRHSNPSLRLSYTRSPKRKPSTRISDISEASLSPKRTVIPSRVKSPGRMPFLRGSDAMPMTSKNLAGVGENEILVKREVEVYEEMVPRDNDSTPGLNPSYSNIWNDPSEQQNFVSTWRDHQDGHTTKDAFLGKLSFETIAESKSQDPHKQNALMGALDLSVAQLRISTANHLETKAKAAMAPPTPPARRSSKDKGIHEGKTLYITRFRLGNGLQGISEDQALEADSETQDQLIPHKKDATPSEPTSSISVRSSSNVLQNKRSVESLSQIEAMIPSQPRNENGKGARSRSPHRKSPKPPRRPSKTLQPAGHPPERPLPDLPIDNDEMRKRSGSSHEIAKKTEKRLSDLSKFGYSPMSVSTVEMPSPRTPADDANLPMAFSSNTIQGLSIDLSGKLARTPGTPVTREPSTNILSGDESPSARTRSRQKKVPTSRGEKIRELKRKHMATTNKARITPMCEHHNEKGAVKFDDSDSTQQVSRSTQTAESSLNNSHGTPAPRSTKHHTTFGSPMNSKRNTFDELDQFPAVPLSRPGSRASITTTIQSTRGIARTNSSPRKSRSRGRTVHGRHSLNQDNKQRGQQPLSHSAIYINVDTDPMTSSFRASGVSRSPSRTRGQPRAISPRKHIDETAATGSSVQAASSPKTSFVAKKQSSRSLRSQTSVSRNLARHGLERVSPASWSRPGSRHNPGLLSSDEDSEHGDHSPKRLASARPGSKSSNKSRLSRKRKEIAMPQLPMTGPFAMEHVLMALAKCQNQGLDISLLSPVDVEKLAHQQKIEDELDSRAAKRLSLVQRPQRPHSGRFDDQNRLLRVKLKLPRPSADLSTMNVTANDTDASTNHRSSDGYSSIEKRGSAGSLTDPTDMELHDLKPSIQRIETKGSAESSRLIRSRRRPSSPTLSTKSFSYYQAQSNIRQPTFPKRASKMLMAPPVAPPRTTSRMQTEAVSSSASLISKVESDKSLMTCNEVIDFDETCTSDPFMLGMLDGMATWSNPVVTENVWRTWGDQGRIIEGKALFTPPNTAMAGVCVT